MEFALVGATEEGENVLSQRALTVLVFVITGLLVLVVVVGLFQKSLDATGVALTLSSVVTGLVTGAYWRDRRKQQQQEEQPEPTSESR